MLIHTAGYSGVSTSINLGLSPTKNQGTHVDGRIPVADDDSSGGDFDAYGDGITVPTLSTTK